MKIIFNVLGFIVSWSVFLCFLSTIYSLYSTIRHAIDCGYASISEGIKDFFSINYSHISKVTKEKKITVCVAILVMCFTLVTSPTIHETIGLHNLLLEEDGTHCYYIEITDRNNTYVLPASVRIEKQQVEYGERTKTITYFYVEDVYFPNGDYLDFSDTINDYVEIGDLCCMYDQYGREWGVKLINEHAYSPYIQETRSGNIFNMVMLIIELFVLALAAISALLV